MKIPFPITFKLLLFILPLVCLPTVIVGYFSYHASIESVTVLSREQQLLQAKAVAEQINNIFRACFMDLKLMAQLIIVEKGVCKKGMESIEDTNGGNDVNGKILKEFLARSPYYKRLRIVNRDGMVMTRVFRDGALFPVEKDFDPVSATHHRKQGASVSQVLRDPLEDGYIVYFARAVHCPDGDSVGYVVLDFDYGKVFDLVRSVVIGVEGYAFMVDHLGCTVAHPRFRPYEYNLSKYSDPRLRNSWWT